MPRGAKRKSAKPRTDAPVRVQRGSGNVFADLKLPSPEVALAKAELVRRICDILAERNLTQAQAAQLLGLDQPKVSALHRGRVEGYSIDRLFRFLNALGSRSKSQCVPSNEVRPQSRGEERSSCTEPHGARSRGGGGRRSPAARAVGTPCSELTGTARRKHRNPGVRFR